MSRNPLRDATFVRHVAYVIAAHRGLPSAASAPIAHAIAEFGQCLEILLDCVPDSPDGNGSARAITVDDRGISARGGERAAL